LARLGGAWGLVYPSFERPGAEDRAAGCRGNAAAMGRAIPTGRAALFRWDPVLPAKRGGRRLIDDGNPTAYGLDMPAANRAVCELTLERETGGRSRGENGRWSALPSPNRSNGGGTWCWAQANPASYFILSVASTDAPPRRDQPSCAGQGPVLGGTSGQPAPAGGSSGLPAPVYHHQPAWYSMPGGPELSKFDPPPAFAAARGDAGAGPAEFADGLALVEHFRKVETLISGLPEIRHQICPKVGYSRLGGVPQKMRPPKGTLVLCVWRALACVQTEAAI